MNRQFIIVIYILSSFVKPALGFTLDRVEDFGKSGADICKDGICGTIGSRYIHRIYGGLFHSPSKLSILDKVSNKILAIPLVNDSTTSNADNRYPDDGAICCSTHVEHINKTKMVNIEGNEVNIIQINDPEEPAYQYVPHASCVRTGSCPGTCVVEIKILHLLTYNTDVEGTIFKFDSFPVPGYCACKNIGSG